MIQSSSSQPGVIFAPPPTPEIWKGRKCCYRHLLSRDQNTAPHSARQLSTTKNDSAPDGNSAKVEKSTADKKGVGLSAQQS